MQKHSFFSAAWSPRVLGHTTTQYTFSQSRGSPANSVSSCPIQPTSKTPGFERRRAFWISLLAPWRIFFWRRVRRRRARSQHICRFWRQRLWWGSAVFPGSNAAINACSSKHAAPLLRVCRAAAPPCCQRLISRRRFPAARRGRRSRTCRPSWR